MPVVLAPQLFPVGITTSPSMLVPATGVRSVRIVPNMQPADRVDPGVSFSFNIEASDDGGQSFQFYAGATFVGRPSIPADPSLTIPVEPVVNKQVRVVLTLSQPLLLGATVDLL